MIIDNRHLQIREAIMSDFEKIWIIFHQIVKTGDTYAFNPDTDKEEAKNIWMSSDVTTYVAEYNHIIQGTYILKPNQPGLGSHVANAAYMVSPEAQGRGIGRHMAEHSLEQARKAGFLAMQFNLVVSTNIPAINLWEKLGFSIIGTLPRAFNHSTQGLVDAHVMYRFL